MCPTIASVGPSAVPLTRAVDDPSASDETSANASPALRHTAAAGASCPDGPGVVSNSRRRSGIGTARQITLTQPPVTLTLPGDDSCSAHLGLAPRAEREPALT